MPFPLPLPPRQAHPAPYYPFRLGKNVRKEVKNIFTAEIAETAEAKTILDSKKKTFGVLKIVGARFPAKRGMPIRRHEKYYLLSNCLLFGDKRVLT
jgi:hypothetical protein